MVRHVPDAARAAELVASSALFDPAWYAAQTGRTYVDRAAAAAAYVTSATAVSATPHPLVEPDFLYPAGRWRDRAPDPLSYLLSTPGERDRAPHPQLEKGAIAWLETAGPRDRVPFGGGRPVTLREVREAALAGLSDDPPPAPGPAPELSVVLGATGSVKRLLWWLRQVWRIELDQRDGGVEIVLAVGSATDRRMAIVSATAFPGTRVSKAKGGRAALLAAGLRAARAPIAVLADTRLGVPNHPWLDALTAPIAEGRAGAAVPLLVRPDQTVVAAGATYDDSGPAPLLSGATHDDAMRIADRAIPAAWPGVLAVDTAAAASAGRLGTGETDLTARLGREGRPTLLRPDVRFTVPEALVDRLAPARIAGRPPVTDPGLLADAGYAAPGEPIRVREGRPALRWAIDIAAPLAPRGRRWGDDVFARSLAAALERRGQWVTIDHPETRDRASREADDVVLTLRGLEQVPVTTAHPARVLWVISHPDEVSAEEVAEHDLTLAAGPAWAAERSAAWGLPIRPLLQCTDTTRFHPGLAGPDTGPEALFVGNSRGAARPAVAQALAQGLDLALYGDGWEGLVPPGAIAGRHVPNAELGALYASAGLVLGDHWEDMRAHGFVANRVFDVLACGGRLLSDDVTGLEEVAGDAVRVWRTAEDFRTLTSGAWREHWPDAAARRRTAERIVAEHSFDARASTLIDLVVPIAPVRS